MADTDTALLGKFVGHSTAIFAVTFFLFVIGVEGHSLPEPIQMLLKLILPIAGFVGWILLLVRLGRAVQRKRSAFLAVLASVPAVIVTFIVVVVVTVMTGILNLNFAHGRPLHDRRRRARVRWGIARSGPAISGIPWRARVRLAAAWLDDARCEQESVTAFERLATRLAAIDAPASIVADARRFARQELGHARACTALAGRHAGVHFGIDAVVAPPIAIRPRMIELADLAAESLVDGCLGEGHSAVAARNAAAATTDLDTRAVLEQIADEEAAHAEHGWAVLEHCLAVGGTSVRERIAAELDRLAIARPVALLARTKATRTLVAFGRAAETHPGETFIAVREDVLVRARALLA